MKYLFIDSYYKSFLTNFYHTYPKSRDWSYERHKKILLSKKFGTSDFFSYNLNKLGEKTQDIIANDEVLQRKWARENGIVVKNNSVISKIQSLPYIYRFLGRPAWIQEITLSQIRKYKPDIIYIQDPSILNPKILNKAKKLCRLLVGQIASPLPPRQYLKPFDLIITSLPHYVGILGKMGIKSKYLKLAFEPRILKRVGKQKRIYNVTFVGSFSPYHKEGTKNLEEVAKSIPVDVWGNGIEFLSPFSPLRRNYHGEAWGVDMYRIFAKSKIVINRHISVAGKFANNARLYEATGMGAMLLTDKKKNLHEIFRVGSEIGIYKNHSDLLKKIDYYLSHDQERNRIARSGQARTLKNHSYRFRMKELIRIIKKYV